MNRFLAFLIGSMLGISTVTSWELYQLTHVKDREIQKLGKKFGQQPTNPQLYPIVHLATNEGRSFCTAFVIDANYAATAGHCIEEKGSLRKGPFKFLTDQNVDTGVEVEAVGYDERTDFGLLQGDFNNFFFLRSDFVNNGFLIGHYMNACGFPFGQKTLACNPIKVVSNNDLAVRVDGFLRNGMSGGPVVDPTTGIAYGINFAITDGYSYVNSLQGFLGLFGID